MDAEKVKDISLRIRWKQRFSNITRQSIEWAQSLPDAEKVELYGLLRDQSKVEESLWRRGFIKAMDIDEKTLPKVLANPHDPIPVNPRPIKCANCCKDFTPSESGWLMMEVLALRGVKEWAAECPLCEDHMDTNPVELVNGERSVVYDPNCQNYRCPVSHCAGIVSLVEDPEDDFWGCGECGSIWYDLIEVRFPPKSDPLFMGESGRP